MHGQHEIIIKYIEDYIIWYKAEAAIELPEKLVDKDTFITYKVHQQLTKFHNTLIAFTNSLKKILVSFYIPRNNCQISKIIVQNSIDVQYLLEKSWLQEFEECKNYRFSTSSSNNFSTYSVTKHNIEN